MCGQITLCICTNQHFCLRLLFLPLTHKQPGHKSAGCRRFKCLNTQPRTQQSKHVSNIHWKLGLRVRVGELLTCEHIEAPYVSEDTRVCFTEQISGHYQPYDPGLHWGHLDYHTDGWTHSQNTQTQQGIRPQRYRGEIRISTCQKLDNPTRRN